MNRNYRRWSLVAVLMVFLLGCTGTPDGVKPISGFELQRYLGTWYEIARLDHPFERGLSRITATYSLRDDGGVSVINRGFDSAERDWREAQGKAYFVDDPATGHLKVSFFGPFYASYVVIALDEDYRWALVSGPDRDYLWILSRSPKLAQPVIEQLVDQANDLGYATEQLIWVEQTAR
ncbi:lipocalin family protein [Aestuariibacter halophilus]|uniref:Outer membrane lipoprotein Blc n=1 Tax=Fluctibacter halophilus TaxID=226011 RepID=A0ABS8GCH6_9ALTE|nr:lipocalin family protein [Aestuariibacter halophilus]MCC2618262.1 lipocalin family protein [Aestuariibacter halophilus]